MKISRLILLGLLLSVFGVFSACSIPAPSEKPSVDKEVSESKTEKPEAILAPPRKLPGLKTNTYKSSIDLDLILSGGPGKDGIPAINEPKFISIQEAELDDEVLGIFLEFDGERRYYPYTILVWHEIVNDNIGDNHFAVTFCPLCGTGILYNREVNGEVLEFGVSGLLYESNLMMYDRKTESLWVQAIGEAVVGDFLGEELEILPMQLIEFQELKAKYPDSKVMSSDTGYRRSYGFYPYGSYEENERLFFPVTIKDKRFHTKEMFYIVPIEDKSFAFLLKDIPEGKRTVSLGGKTIELVRDGGEISIGYKGKSLPGYYEMWFSWATHHQEDGVIWTEDSI